MNKMNYKIIEHTHKRKCIDFHSILAKQLAFYCFFFISFTQNLQAVSICKYVFPQQTSLVKADLDNTNSLIKALEKTGVSFYAATSDNKHTVSILLTTEGSHPLNLLANHYFSKYEGLSFVIRPKEVSGYCQNSHIIVLGKQVFDELFHRSKTVSHFRLIDSIDHELSHAKFAIQRMKAKSSPLDLWAGYENSNKVDKILPKFSERNIAYAGYKHFFSFEELYAYSRNIRVQKIALKKILAQITRSENIDLELLKTTIQELQSTIFTGITLTKFALGILDKALIRLERENLKIWEENLQSFSLKSSDQKILVIALNNSGVPLKIPIVGERKNRYTPNNKVGFLLDELQLTQKSIKKIAGFYSLLSNKYKRLRENMGLVHFSPKEENIEVLILSIELFLKDMERVVLLSQP